MKYILFLTISFFTLGASDAFITPSELKQSLKDKNLIILDVSKPSIYKESHIKGAIYADTSKFVNKESNYSLIASPEVIQNQLQKLGINNNSKVVIYSHNTKAGSLNSSYMALVLLYSGFENLSILDGGYMAWVFENELLTSSLLPKEQESGTFTIDINKNILITLNYLEENLSVNRVLDARSPQEYYGVERSNNIGSLGHISSAKSSFYMDKFLIDGTLRDKNELKQIYIQGHDLEIDNSIIVYGNSVFDASMEFYILYKHMGFKNTKLYEASLMEWGNSLDLPMTRFKWE